MLNLQANFVQGSKEWDELEHRIICIQHFQQLSIDSVKGIKMTPMKNQWNNLQQCLPSPDDTPEIAEQKAFDKKICAYRKPFFFIYRYNTTKAKYDDYVKKVDSKLKQKYNISLDELLNSDNLSADLIKEREIYYNRCPVDMSPGLINRIAWAVSDKFNDFYSLPVEKFDKNIIKSGVKYEKIDFYTVRDIYNEYKKCINNLIKRTKNDDILEEEDGSRDKSLIDSMFRTRFYEACPNEQILCEILIDLLYDKPNSKGVVWDMCGNVIINNLLQKTNGIMTYPEVVSDEEDFACCRKKFRMKSVNIGGEVDGEI
jgi:hypothetical protein